MTALQHGKHVMVKKPVALSLEDSDRMIAAAAKNRVKLMVAQTRSFNPPIVRCARSSATGSSGRAWPE
ncbi:MAG TPA: Gfo/Idh/MocA family oxidoreductase [Candidatus Binatia bacterium]